MRTLKKGCSNVAFAYFLSSISLLGGFLGCRGLLFGRFLSKGSCSSLGAAWRRLPDFLQMGLAEKRSLSSVSLLLPSRPICAGKASADAVYDSTYSGLVRSVGFSSSIGSFPIWLDFRGARNLKCSQMLILGQIYFF